MRKVRKTVASSGSWVNWCRRATEPGVANMQVLPRDFEQRVADSRVSGGDGVAVLYDLSGILFHAPVGVVP